MFFEYLVYEGVILDCWDPLGNNKNFPFLKEFIIWQINLLRQENKTHRVPNKEKGNGYIGLPECSTWMFSQATEKSMLCELSLQESFQDLEVHSLILQTTFTNVSIRDPFIIFTYNIAFGFPNFLKW